MQRILAVAALLVLSLPTAASPLDGDAPKATVSVDPQVPVGNPILRVPLSVWAPALREHGYVAAAQAAGEPGSGRQASSQSEAQQEEEDEDEVPQHGFLPLGDANGNGRDDVILVTSEGDSIRYEALDGGRPDHVLWTLDVDEDDSYAYLVGDVDEDGVLDLERLTEVGAEGDGSDEGPQEERVEATILSGRDLAQMTSVQLVSRFSYERTDPEPVVLVGRSTSRETMTFEYLMDLEDQPGLARITWTTEWSETQERLVITTSDTMSFNTSSAIAVLDPSGALRWSHDEPGWDVVHDMRDVTGDGVRDVLVRTNDNYAMGGEARLPMPVQPPVQPPVPVPLLTSTQHTRPEFRLRLLDGADGAPVWEQPFGNASYSDVGWVGDLFGAGPVLSLYAAEMDRRHDLVSERTFLIEGGSGTVVHQTDHALFLTALGDADADGDDDLLRYDFNDSILRLQAVDGTFRQLWDLEVLDDEFAGLLDITGDGVLDVLTRQDDNVTVLSGTNGKEAWDRLEETLAFARVAPGIVEDTDHEVALVLSEAKDHEDLADHDIDLLLLRGSDGAPLWNKPLYDPDDYLPATADGAHLSLMPAGDLNGDGANDFIVAFRQMGHVAVTMECEDDVCQTSSESEEDEDEGQPVRIAALVDGATGATITRFDDMELAEKVKQVTEAPVDIAPAAEDLKDADEGVMDIPAGGFLALLALLGVASLVRRRA